MEILFTIYVKEPVRALVAKRIPITSGLFPERELPTSALARTGPFPVDRGRFELPTSALQMLRSTS